MEKRSKVGLIGFVILLVMGSGYFMLNNNHSEENDNSQYQIEKKDNIYVVIDKKDNAIIKTSINKLEYTNNEKVIDTKEMSNEMLRQAEIAGNLTIIDKDEVFHYYSASKVDSYFYAENNQINGHFSKDGSKETIEFTKIKPIYQKITEYDKLKCKGGLFKDKTISHKGCMMVNFVMFNNAQKEQQTSVEQLLEKGFDCQLDYQKAAAEFNYANYQLIDLKDNYTSNLNYEFANSAGVVTNGKATFSIKEYFLTNKLPLMIWVIPKGETKLDNGHLITIYKYEKDQTKEQYYFYDSFNKETPARDLNEFMTRWQFAQVHVFAK